MTSDREFLMITVLDFQGLRHCVVRLVNPILSYAKGDYEDNWRLVSWAMIVTQALR